MAGAGDASADRERRPAGDGERNGSGSRSGLSDHDRRRLRATYRTALGGLVLGILGAAAVGLLGAPGQAGAAVLFVLAAAGCMAAALVTAVLAMVDEYRRRPVGRPRTLMALWFFLASAALLLMSTGIAAG
jgi:hypothetical protein